MSPKVINDLKQIDWQKIIDYGCSLDDLNDHQWRAIKGLTMELAVEKNSTMKYVGRVHCDFDWPLHNMTVELKTQLGREGGDGFWKTYKKTGLVRLKNNIVVKINNSRGTNKKTTLTTSDVADIVIVPRRDGVVAFDQSTVIKYAVQLGDGFEMRVPVDQVNQTIPGGHIIIGPITSSNKYKRTTTLKQDIVDAIRNNIP